MNPQRPGLLLAAAALLTPALATADGPYLGIAAGANFARDQNVRVAGSDASLGTLYFDDGYIGALALGWAAANGWRPELELSARGNDIGNLVPPGGGSSGEHSANALMANLWYDLPAPGPLPRLRPYFGIGVGAASLEYENAAIGSADDVVTAWQGGLGVNVSLGERAAAGLGYRYFRTEDASFADAGVDAQHESDSVMASLRWSFGSSAARPAPAPVARYEAPLVMTDDSSAFETIVLQGINFKFDRSDFTEPARATLDGLAAQMAQHPQLRVLIEGHTDALGPQSYNDSLAMRRAHAVRQYLIDAGVEPSRLEMQALGEDVPDQTNQSPDGRAANRRAELYPLETPSEVRVRIEEPAPESKDAAVDPDDPGPGRNPKKR